VNLGLKVLGLDGVQFTAFVSCENQLDAAVFDLGARHAIFVFEANRVGEGL
jgi:hypothetical protein